jgi:hypothetical protein
MDVMIFSPSGGAGVQYQVEWRWSRGMMRTHYGLAEMCRILFLFFFYQKMSHKNHAAASQ